MFKYTNNKALIQFHCKHSICPINGKTYKWFFLSDDSYLDIYIDANIHPATKEQSDFLFQKIHEAGYEWDVEKKELKKAEQKTAWSEEDEEIHRKCICAMRASACGFPEEEKFVEQVDNWLKSLKDRYAWKPSEKQILAIETAINVIGKGTLNGGQLTELLEQLKAL